MTDIIESSTDAPDDGASSRRALFGKAAIAAAVTTAAGLAMSRQAGAANGDTMTVGTANSATATTSITGGSTFQVTNGTTAGAGSRTASIYGTSNASSGVGVLGSASGSSGRGVYGRSSGSSGVGVYGEHNSASTSGNGVFGTSNRGVGVVGSGSTFDVQASGSGRVLLSANGVANPPAAASTVGTIAKDSAGNMWVCVASGNPGTWRKVAGPGTAGAFHALTPGRVYDSRATQPSQGALSGGQNRTISVKDRRKADGTVDLADFVPAGATAIAANVTVQTQSGSGFLSVNPGGNTSTDSSTINWSAAGQLLANGVTLTLNANRELTVACGGGGSTEFIIDVSGYYL
ncbi:MAG: hypothetical protein R2713_18840 [Ilumatobacteraceae bacterium]|nr:hypothetical protein [Acidimicrobiales bacterium]MCB9392036.1 hypothetical protein [Acidimicrobiaceae bacterium]